MPSVPVDHIAEFNENCYCDMTPIVSGDDDTIAMKNWTEDSEFAFRDRCNRTSRRANMNVGESERASVPYLLCCFPVEMLISVLW